MSLPTEVVSYSGTQQRLLEMLGNGLAPTVCASALGISESYISQCLGEEEFAMAVTAKRFANLQAATKRDRSYDSIEDELIEKMQQLLPMMYKPMEVLRAITVINAAKRRGADAAPNTVVHTTIVKLTIPVAVQAKFVRNVNNQVIEAGEQELVTIAATNLTDKLKNYKAETLNPQLSLLSEKDANNEHNSEGSDNRATG